MYLLDTNVLSETRIPHRTNPNVARWFDQVAPERLFISVVTVFEIELGALRLIRRDPPAGQSLRNWIDQKIMPEFDTRIIDIDRRVMKRSAELQVPKSRPDHDTLIAATALVHGLVMVTRNVKDFADTGVEVVNPFDGV